MILFPNGITSYKKTYISCFILVCLVLTLPVTSTGSELSWKKSKSVISLETPKSSSEATAGKAKRKSGVSVGTAIGIGIAVGTILRGAKSSGDEKSSLPQSRSAVRYQPEIARIQKCLNKLGYAAGKADGIPGPKTRMAFSDFAGQHGMKVKGLYDKKASNMLLQQCNKPGDISKRPVVAETGTVVTTTACKDDTWRYKNREEVAMFEWKLPTPLEIDIQPANPHGEHAVIGAENFLGSLASLFGLLDIIIDPSASNVAAGVAGVPTSPMGYAGFAASVGSKITQAAKRIGDKISRKLLNLTASFQWHNVKVKCGAIEICKQGSWVDGGLWPLEKPHRGEPYGRVSYKSKHNPFEGKTLGGNVQAAWRWYSSRGKVGNLEKFNLNPCRNADESKASEEPTESTAKQKDCRNCDRLKNQIKQVEDEVSRLKSDKVQLQKDLQAVAHTEMDGKEKLESNYRKCVQQAREESEKGMIHGAVNRETGHIIGTTDPAGLSGLDPNVWEIYDGGDKGKSLESQKRYKDKMFKAGKERCDKLRQQGLGRLQDKMDKKRQSLNDKLQTLEEKLRKAQQKQADLQKQYQDCIQGCNQHKE
jgi:peptidoglycan hydrolase-like protein with peptidoglycan-binding domain